MHSIHRLVAQLLGFGMMCFGAPAFASSGNLDLVHHSAGFIAVAIFIVAYALVMAEEHLSLRKSKPVLVAAGLIWILIGFEYAGAQQSTLAEEAFQHTLLEFAELMLFLLVAMTYINAMEERRVFDALREWMIRKGFSYRTLFWVTGLLSFFISPIADNLTTALLMCAVIIKVADAEDTAFINVSCVNVVIAANAGGAFSPFGDITTLMVWQEGIVQFGQFFALFLPSLVNYLIPAVIMSFFISAGKPSVASQNVELKRGARRIIVLFLLTITTAVACHTLIHFPPVMGMMMGLGYLQFFGYFLRKTLPRSLERKRAIALQNGDEEAQRRLGNVVPFDVFGGVARAEWDTLLFFYGVVMCVGGLGFMGYLALLSETLYGGWDAAYANIALGAISAVVDNIPIMFAVLTMEPAMSLGNWLLITLTAGVGGSLLSIGSAAGVALMGQARGRYTFFGHLKWSPVIALGYFASIAVHMWINAASFDVML